MCKLDVWKCCISWYLKHYRDPVVARFLLRPHSYIGFIATFPYCGFYCPPPHIAPHQHYTPTHIAPHPYCGIYCVPLIFWFYCTLPYCGLNCATTNIMVLNAPHPYLTTILFFLLCPPSILRFLLCPTNIVVFIAPPPILWFALRHHRYCGFTCAPPKHDSLKC